MCEVCPIMFRNWVKAYYEDDASGRVKRRTHEVVVLEKEAKRKAIAARKEFFAKRKTK